MKKIKSYINSNYPALWSALRYTRSVAKNWPLLFKSNKAIFNEIYKKNLWGDSESKSGDGSNLEKTKTLREQLPILVKELGVKTFLDAPCGDFNWMKDVNLGVEAYIGGDIVEELIKDCQKRYAKKGRKFFSLDLMNDDIPTVDLIFCRDCLVHFSFQDIRRAIQNFKRSSSVYILTTTFTGMNENVDICTGDWRPINLQLDPFNFPTPIKLIKERNLEVNGHCADKSLGLWRISDLNRC